ncbi:hypothetical protein [Streptomyces sp. NRRL F-5123]|uniref:hypothetical protein n=1 Tax=Streptomyces sp. NRRL F-5123 TaxID=1463856 RepID=UPI0004E1B4B3|nr:hypothetical protein [Streptomyces sp. NRRL F-5123]
MLIAWWVLVLVAAGANMTYWLRRARPARIRFEAEHRDEFARMGSRERSFPGPEGSRILVLHTVTFLLLVTVGVVGAVGLSGHF